MGVSTNTPPPPLPLIKSQNNLIIWDIAEEHACVDNSPLRTTTENHAHHPCPVRGGGAYSDNVMLCDQEANPVYRHEVETLVGGPVNRTG